MALALCLTLLPAASLAAETAPARVTLAGTELVSGKSYIPKTDGGIKEKTDQTDANYLTYDGGVLTVHGTVAVNCNNGDGLSFYDGVLTLAGDGDLTITASGSSAVSGSPGSTLTTAEGFSGSITLGSENRSAVQNVKLNLTTKGDIRISSADSNAVNTPTNPVTLAGKTVTIETTANSAVSVSTVTAPSLNVTAGGDVTITGNGNLPLIADANGNECAVTLSAGGNVTIVNRSGTAVFGPLTVAKAVDVEIESGGGKPMLHSESGTHSITASGTVRMESGGTVLSGNSTGLTIRDAETVGIAGETSAPVVTGMTLRGCGTASVTRLGDSETPIADKIDSDIPVLLRDGPKDDKPQLLWKNKTYQKADTTGMGDTMAPTHTAAVYYEAGKGYVMFSQLSNSDPTNGAASAILFNARSKDKGIEGNLTGIEVIGENALKTIYVLNLEGESLSITGTGTLQTNMTSAVPPTMAGGVTFDGLVCVNKGGTQENPTMSLDFTAYGRNSVLPPIVSGNTATGKFVVGAVSDNKMTMLVSLTVQNGATLTIPENVTLEISDRKYLSSLRNNGTLVNNSTVSIPDATAADIKALRLTGSGLVQVAAGTGYTYYTNEGAALGNLKVDNLDLSNASGDQGKMETDGYHWNNRARSLTLNGLAVTGTLTLPKGAENIKIAVQKESLVNDLSYNDSYRPTVRIVGREPLTVQNVSGDIRLTVERDAALNAGAINIGASGNKDSIITVKGKLTVKGSQGVSCGQMVIGATGVVNISGERGVMVAGMNPNGVSDFKDAFKIENGGSFSANCTAYNVMVFTGSKEMTEEEAKTCLVLPDNYLPEGYSIQVATGNNGSQVHYAATVAKKDAHLTLSAEHVYGAGGQLELKFQTAPKPGAEGGNGGGGTGGGSSSGGGGGSDRDNSGSGSTSMYAILVAETVYGSATPNVTKASQGTRITVTVKPDSGYELGTISVKDASGNTVKITDKGNGTYTFTMPGSKVTISAEFVGARVGSAFADVPSGAHYAKAVEWAVKNGVTNGKANGLFGSNDPCTRAQIVTLLWRAAGSPEPKGTVSFVDVSAGSYYAKAVAWAVENGITGGTGNGLFSPDATCTRAQSAAFLYRAASSPAVNGSAGFSDVAADAYYARAVAWAVENGVTNGIGDGLFGPDNSCTRAQIVTFLYRAYRGK